MNAIHERASVAPKTVTRYSQGKVGASPSTRRRKQRILAVEDGYAVRIDPRIMAVLHAQGTDFRCVEVLSATEVIVHNQRIR